MMHDRELLGLQAGYVVKPAVEAAGPLLPRPPRRENLFDIIEVAAHLLRRLP